MSNRLRSLENECGAELKPQSGHSLADRIEQVMASTTAHCLMTEALIHALCFENQGINRTRLLNILDIVHDQLLAGLGGEDEIVRAFGEQRDSLRSLLVSSVIQAEMELSGGR